jgi:hypothetical protein
VKFPRNSSSRRRRFENTQHGFYRLALTLRFFSSESIQISEAEDAAAKEEGKE